MVLLTDVGKPIQILCPMCGRGYKPYMFNECPHCGYEVPEQYKIPRKEPRTAPRKKTKRMKRGK